jgi:hypothetical protein
MAELDPLEMLLRAMPFDERMALEDKWLAAGTPPEAQLAEAEALAAEMGDGCEL